MYTLRALVSHGVVPRYIVHIEIVFGGQGGPAVQLLAEVAAWHAETFGEVQGEQVWALRQVRVTPAPLTGAPTGALQLLLPRYLYYM